MAERPDDRAGVTYTVRVEHGRRREDAVTPEHGPVTPPYIHHPSGVSHVRVHVDPTGKSDKEMDNEALTTAYQIAHSTGGGGKHDMVTKTEIIHLEAAYDQSWRPHDRLFGPTKGKEDPRLFDADHQMLPEVRKHLMEKMTAFMAKHGGPDWTDWSRMYLAGSEASDWYGNNDFDILLGVDYDGFRRATSSHLSDEEITDAFNTAFRADWNDEDWHPPFDDDVWHLTGYVNQDSYDIRRIKPYAAYNVAENQWAVEPMQVPDDWGPDKFPESTWRLAEHYANEIDRISTLSPASVQQQHAQRLFDHIHTDRSRAFGPHGTGVFDVGNVAEKYLDQRPDHPLALLVEMKNQPVGKTAAAGDPWYATASDEEIDAHHAAESIREDLTTHTHGKTTYRIVKHPGRMVSAHVMPSGRKVGAMTWFGGKKPHDKATTEGVIHKVVVSAPHRRKGLASAMLDHARATSPKDEIGHSFALSDDGKAWAEKKALRLVAATTPCWECGGKGHRTFDDARGTQPCQYCEGTGHRHTADYEAHPLPEHQQRINDMDYRDSSREHLNLAKSPSPGTHVWRGEVRHKDEVEHLKSGGDPTMGMHWSVKPDMTISPNNHGADAANHRHVMWHAEVSHPDQTVPRSHSSWFGKHRSLDSEAEVRFKPGAKVHVHGAYVWEGEGEPKGKAYSHLPERSHGDWKYHPVGRTVTVEHRRPADGMMDYPNLPRSAAHMTDDEFDDAWAPEHGSMEGYRPPGKRQQTDEAFHLKRHLEDLAEDEHFGGRSEDRGEIRHARENGYRRTNYVDFGRSAAIKLRCSGCGEDYFTDDTGNPVHEGHLHDHWTTAAKKDWEPPTVSGIALRAKDTGRLLMIQRSNNDEKDPARGTWEFPGGHHEEGDTTSLHAGIREWEEEVGHPFPEGGSVEHTWRTGPYQGHLVVIPEESAVDFSQGRRTTNPDDPDGDDHEQSAWWDPEHARKNPALRQECKDNWSHILPGLKATAVDDSEYSYKHVVHQPKYGDHRYGDSVEPQSPEQVYNAPGRGAHYGAHVFEHQIVHKGTPVGKLRYSVLPQDSHVLQINGLAVHPDHQHSGLAVKMADKMQEHARAHGMKIDHGNYTDQGHAFSRKYMASPNYDSSLHLPYPEKPSATTGEQFLPHMLDEHEMQHGRTASVGGWIHYYANEPEGWEIEHDHLRNLRIGGTVHNSLGRVLPRQHTAATQEEQEHRLSSLWFPEHQSTRFKPVQGLIHGARAYAEMKGLPDPHSQDFHKVVTTPDRIRDVGRAYDSLPHHDHTAEGSFHAMRTEVGHQYDHLTKRMGVKVESVHEDPYSDVHEMTHDIEHNKRLKVLSTKTTGSHPLFSDEDNDKFRAVHDAFGHAATGRGFDRHGEEAAYQAHAKMFTHAARGALTSETRGQNASLNLNGHFGPQKVALMPSHFGRTASIYLAKQSLPKTQKCNWCKGQATKRMLWAEGMAYIPTCDEHEAKTRHHIEVNQHDEVVSTRPV